MEAWGLTSCLVRIGHKVYAQSFIVCNKMMTNVIVGKDFPLYLQTKYNLGR